MNILQCVKSLYDLVYPPKTPRSKIYVSTSPVLRGTIVSIRSPDTITLLSMEPIYAKTCVKICGIITPDIRSSDTDEQSAAKYVVKQMRYRYLEKYAISDNSDVRCGDEYIWKWMVANRLAVMENTPVPKNWKEYREVGKPTVSLLTSVPS